MYLQSPIICRIAHDSRTFKYYTIYYLTPIITEKVVNTGLLDCYMSGGGDALRIFVYTICKYVCT